MTKQEIRAEMRKRRKAVTPADRAAASARICERLAALLLPNAQTSKHPNFRTCIAVYLASADEIDLTSFIEDTCKNLGLTWEGRACRVRAVSADATSASLPACCVRLVAPRWNGAGYELAELGGELVAGPHGILEPPQDAPLVAADAVGAWIVPGLAFTRDGKRLGYGGGWYDRMMADARLDARKIGVGYAFQIVDALPSEPHDIRLDEIVTD